MDHTAPDLIRRADIEYVLESVANARCCSIVGVSNMGKSHLLRVMSAPGTLNRVLGNRAGQFLFVYIDFNLMLNVSEQGFYELIMRSILAELEAAHLRDLSTRVRQAYQGVIAPTIPLAVSLSFLDGLTVVMTSLKRRLVLLCDAFNEPFAALDGRVFLNLRGLKDRYPQDICYVTVTEQRLRHMRQDHSAFEFAELFDHNTHFLRPLERSEALLLIDEIATAQGIQFTPQETDFAWTQAGGHPGLLEVVCQTLAEARQMRLDSMAGDQALKRVRELLDNDPNVRAECAELWNDLSDPERQNLVTSLDGIAANGSDESWRALSERGVLIPSDDGTARVFGQLFRDFAYRQKMINQRNIRGLRIDVEAGEVRVDGKPVRDLTDQEYRLLLLLYGNIDRTCDKYKIVQAVWSEAFIDEVDDARIEKLISRVRQKIEPDANEPKFLLTVRGRGYKLSSHQE